MTRDQWKRTRKWAPLILSASGLMVVFCSILNAARLHSLDAALSLVPFFGITGLYAWALHRRKA